MELFLAIISILFVTIVVSIAVRILHAPFLCPVCLGVSLTWFWMLLAIWSGWSADPLIPAILMGGSSVGAALKFSEGIKKPLIALRWKTIFIVSGFGLTYGIIVGSWLWGWLFALILAGLIIWLILYRGRQTRHSRSDSRTERIEKELEECC